MHCHHCLAPGGKSFEGGPPLCDVCSEESSAVCYVVACCCCDEPTTYDDVHGDLCHRCVRADND